MLRQVVSTPMMLTDLNKGITAISYNYLNLPVEIMIGTGKIQYTYTASGAKLQKKVYSTLTSTLPETTDYLNGYQYVSNVLQFFPTAEGYVDAVRVGTNTVFTYVYNYTDHLGNVRLSYAYDINNATLKIMEEMRSIRKHLRQSEATLQNNSEQNNYYPFGLKMRGFNFSKSNINPPVQCPTCPPVFVLSQDTNYKYKYQGQERQDELGLNWDSFKWRKL